MTKGKYSSNSGIFAKRGDPWVSEKEGRERFGRNTLTENPDFDQFFARKAEPKPRFVDPPKPKPEASYASEKQDIINKMHKKIWAEKLKRQRHYK